MSKRLCGFLGLLKTCKAGPKGRHKCGEENKRVRGVVHEGHVCKHCMQPFTKALRVVAAR